MRSSSSAEPPNTVEKLRRKTDVLAEQLDEPGMAQASLQLDSSNAAYRIFTRQLSDRVAKRGMQRRLWSVSAQVLLHRPELFRLARCAAQVIE